MIWVTFSWFFNDFGRVYLIFRRFRGAWGVSLGVFGAPWHALGMQSECIFMIVHAFAETGVLLGLSLCVIG